MGRVWQVRDDEPTVSWSTTPPEPSGSPRRPPAAPRSWPAVGRRRVRGRGARERVPRKSTSFGPKPRSGMVIRTFADS